MVNVIAHALPLIPKASGYKVHCADAAAKITVA